MLTIFVPTGSALKKVDCGDLGSLPESAVWIDMFNPTPEDRTFKLPPLLSSGTVMNRL